MNSVLHLLFVSHHIRFSLSPVQLSSRLPRGASNMHALCSTCSSKCSKGNILFETPHASIINIIILFIYLFIAIIFFSFSLGPDNPPHPWLISRKGTGSAVCSGLSFKNACSSSEHTLRLAGEQASSLLWGKRTTGR